MKRYFIILNLLCLAALSYFSVSIFYTAVQARLTAVEVRPASAPEPGERVQEDRPPAADVNRIVARNLFRTRPEAPKEEAGKPVDVDTLKQTDLNLKLWGTITGEGGRPLAVIEDPKLKKQELFAAGDSLENAVVKLVLRERVVLTVDGKDEVLEMEDMRSLGRPGVRPVDPGARARAAGIARDQQLRSQARAQRVRLRRAVIDESLQDIGKVLETIRVRPQYEDGQVAGIMLTNIHRSPIFRQMRLLNGDVLKTVNGQAITSAGDVAQLYDNLRSTGEMSVEIKRRGRLRTIEYDIE